MTHDWMQIRPERLLDASYQSTYQCSRCGSTVVMLSVHGNRRPSNIVLRNYGIPEDCDEALAMKVLES